MGNALRPNGLNLMFSDSKIPNANPQSPELNTLLRNGRKISLIAKFMITTKKMIKILVLEVSFCVDSVIKKPIPVHIKKKSIFNAKIGVSKS